MRIIRITVKRDDCPKIVVTEEERKNGFLPLLSGLKEMAVMYGKKVRNI